MRSLQPVKNDFDGSIGCAPDRQHWPEAITQDSIIVSIEKGADVRHPFFSELRTRYLFSG